MKVLLVLKPVFLFSKLKSVQGGKLTHCENVKIDWGLELVSDESFVIVCYLLISILYVIK